MPLPLSSPIGAAALSILLLAAVAHAQEDAPVAGGLRPGDVITFDQIERLKPVLPPEFWANATSSSTRA